MKKRVLLLLSALFCMYYAKAGAAIGITGHRLNGHFTIHVKFNKKEFPFPSKKVRVAIVPGETFAWSENDSEEQKGKTITFDTTMIFLNLPNQQTVAPLSALLESLNPAIPQEEKTISKEDADDLMRLFFNENKTNTMFESLAFSAAFKVILPNGKPGLVLKPE